MPVMSGHMEHRHPEMGEVTASSGTEAISAKAGQGRDVPPNADGKQKRHCAIKLNANERLDNLLSTRCMAPQLHEEKTGLPCALCESGREKNNYFG